MPQLGFTIDEKEITIQCNENEKMKDVFQKYATKSQTIISKSYFLYNGEMIKPDSRLKEIRNDEDKIRSTIMY